MSEPTDKSISSRLKQQAEQLEHLALDAGSRSTFHTNGVEEEELGSLVELLSSKLGDIRLANVQERLRDV